MTDKKDKARTESPLRFGSWKGKSFVLRQVEECLSRFLEQVLIDCPIKIFICEEVVVKGQGGAARACGVQMIWGDGR